MPSVDKSSKNTRAMTGEFAVLSQLALRGLVATLTLGSTKGVDILVLNPKNKRIYQLEVKTRFRTNPTRGELLFEWVMNEKHEKIRDRSLLYCFVNINKKDLFRFFVVPSSVVAAYVRREHQEWRKKKPRLSDNKMRTFRLRDKLGVDGGKWSRVPLAMKHEGNWGLLN